MSYQTMVPLKDKSRKGLFVETLFMLQTSRSSVLGQIYPHPKGKVEKSNKYDI